MELLGISNGTMKITIIKAQRQMAYNQIDEKFLDEELKQILSARPKKTGNKRYNDRIYNWRKRFETGEMRTGKKIEILLTYGDFELTKKKN